MRSSWSSGSTRAWRIVRARVLAANALPAPEGNDGRCVLSIDGRTMCPRHRRRCDSVCTVEATHAHHTRGRSRTGDDPRFIVAACAACNLHVGDPSKWATPDPPGRGVTQW